MEPTGRWPAAKQHWVEPTKGEKNLDAKGLGRDDFRSGDFVEPRSQSFIQMTRAAVSLGM